MRWQAMWVLVAIGWLAGSSSFAQEKNPIPPRYQSFAKTAPFRLVRVLGTVEQPPAYSQTTAFSADGRRAIYAEDLSSGTNDKPRLLTRISVWDTQTKTWPRELEIAGKSVTALHVSPNGDKAILAGITQTEKRKPSPEVYLSLWDLNAGKEIKTILTEERAIQSVALAPDEATALTGTNENLKLWDLKKGKELVTYAPKNKSSVTAILYLPDSKQFLAGHYAGKIDLWDLKGEKPIRSYRSKAKQQSFVWWLTLARDGKRFASGDFQSSVSLWDLETGKEINTLQVEPRPVEEFITALALADDGKTVLASWSKANPLPDDTACGRLLAWDGEANKVFWSRETSYRGRLPIHAQADKAQLGGGPNLFEVWDWKQGKRLQSWGGPKAALSAAVADAQGRVYSAAQNGIVHVWEKGQVVQTIPAHRESITALALHPKGTHLFTTSADKTIRVWELPTGKLTQTLADHTASVTAIVLNRDGKRAYTGSSDRTVKVWDLETGKVLATHAGHSEGVNAVALSADESWLVSGSDDTAIRVWPLKAGKLDPDREAILLEGHKKAITCLTFSLDGKTLLSGSQDQTLKSWDWARGKSLRTMSGHKNWITSLLVMDDASVLTTSDDLTLCRWDVNSGKETGRIDFGEIGDCPRCLAKQDQGRIVVGTSSWVLFEFHLAKE